MREGTQFACYFHPGGRQELWGRLVWVIYHVFFLQIMLYYGDYGIAFVYIYIVLYMLWLMNCMDLSVVCNIRIQLLQDTIYHR